ncbi:hypothetical protein DPEC_G00225950 [Dallia pectoralis]|uniref:Uncharacterized protein n=1 Tax=Dallia pectoralis TaxID=75939 RepID=A0ACC2G087_DALPE|nr:hypothetical protein DPEC_G00225950 [Dallia pectoralis]
MSDPEVREQLQALGQRVQDDKAVISQLMEANEALTEQLWLKTPTAFPSPSSAGGRSSSSPGAGRKIQAVKEWRSPRSLAELKSFLGFASFYRRFVKNFASIAARCMLYGHWALQGLRRPSYLLMCSVRTGIQHVTSCEVATSLAIPEATLTTSFPSYSTEVLLALQKKDPVISAFWKKLSVAYEDAGREVEKAAEARRRSAGPPAKDSVLPPGNLVYLRNRLFTGRHKIQDLWVPAPYQVVARLGPNKPVYTVAPLDASKPPRNVHRTELRPCGPGLHIRPAQDPLAEQDSESSSDREWRRVIRGTETNPETKAEPRKAEGVIASSLALVEPVVSSESDEGGSERAPSPVVLRRSERRTAGLNTNPFRLPRSAKVDQGGRIEAVQVELGRSQSGRPRERLQCWV